MTRSWAYNRFGVLMGTSGRASSPRWPSLRGDVLPMITLLPSQGDFCVTEINPFPPFWLKVQDLLYRAVDILESLEGSPTYRGHPALVCFLGAGNGAIIRRKRKELDQRAVRAVFELPARLAHNVLQPRLLPVLL